MVPVYNLLILVKNSHMQAAYDEKIRSYIERKFGQGKRR